MVVAGPWEDSSTWLFWCLLLLLLCLFVMGLVLLIQLLSLVFGEFHLACLQQQTLVNFVYQFLGYFKHPSYLLKYVDFWKDTEYNLTVRFDFP